MAMFKKVQFSCCEPSFSKSEHSRGVTHLVTSSPRCTETLDMEAPCLIGTSLGEGGEGAKSGRGGGEGFSKGVSE